MEPFYIEGEALSKGAVCGDLFQLILTLIVTKSRLLRKKKKEEKREGD